MAGSVAEERIRGKAEALLRASFPDGRIIHELVLEQWGCRIDLACVTPKLLVVAEVKSERDVLTRLEAQVTAARKVADRVAVCVAPDHVEKAKKPLGTDVYLFTEDGDALKRVWGAWGEPFDTPIATTPCNSPDRLSMLWAAELRSISGVRGTRPKCIHAASDSMTGAQVRRVVCAALRAREFPRADPAIPFEHQIMAA